MSPPDPRNPPYQGTYRGRSFSLLTDAYNTCDSLCMRTTLDIDAELLSEAMQQTGAATKTAAAHLGLKAFVDSAARSRLAALGGRIPEATGPRRRRSSGQEASR